VLNKATTEIALKRIINRNYVTDVKQEDHRKVHKS